MLSFVLESQYIGFVNYSYPDLTANMRWQNAWGKTAEGLGSRSEISTHNFIFHNDFWKMVVGGILSNIVLQITPLGLECYVKIWDETYENVSHVGIFFMSFQLASSSQNPLKAYTIAIGNVVDSVIIPNMVEIKWCSRSQTLYRLFLFILNPYSVHIMAEILQSHTQRLVLWKICLTLTSDLTPVVQVYSKTAGNIRNKRKIIWMATSFVDRHFGSWDRNSMIFDSFLPWFSGIS